MISSDEYFGAKRNHPDCTDEVRANAKQLLLTVNALLAYAEEQGGYTEQDDPDTGTEISGSRNGFGDGGFRLSTSTTGAAKSAHKLGAAVDVYDPVGQLDKWLTDDILIQFCLYREAPDATPSWCHLQIIAPGSGRRTFHP